MNASGLEFIDLTSRPRGTLFELLAESYRSFFISFPQLEQCWKDDWCLYDEEVHVYPDTVGRFGFLSLAGGDIIGFCSFEPRPEAAYGVIGYNCVLPKFRRRNFGRAQIFQTLRIMDAQKIPSARVCSGVHPFFLPARKMYWSCGFQERRRLAPSRKAPFERIEYDRPIGNRGTLVV